ncbi:MAG: T9SS type A sorting domain-containing protein [Muribaculum sp.]|nr:T9SS type A sorting domain-containing protein [Muribaculum sp.]
MKKSTILLIAAVAVAGSANAQLRWDPENSWYGTHSKSYDKLSDDKKSVIHELVRQDNGNYRNDLEYYKDVTFTEDEPYFVVQFTTQNCSWNELDFKFQFMLQRQVSEGLKENGDVQWSANTSSFDPEFPSFRDDKNRVIGQWHADTYHLLGASVVNPNDGSTYSDDIYVINLAEEVQGNDGDKTKGLLFSAGDVYFPHFNPWNVIQQPDENGLNGKQQRSWLGFVCGAHASTVTSDKPTVTVHYTGTVADSSDALTVCENYSYSEGGKEVREDDEEDPNAVSTLQEEKVNVYLKNGKCVVANGASISVYGVDGKLVMNGFDNVELPAGVYVVKAQKNGISNTVKAIVR